VVPALQPGLERRRGQSAEPGRLKTDYLWKRILTRELTDILENYAQVVERRTPRRAEEADQIFPRYHQLDVVRKLLADAGRTARASAT
jgi:type I restriction enzyme R subunit